MRLSIDFDCLRYGECTGFEDAKGEPGMELTLRKSSDMGVFFGMTVGFLLIARETDEAGFGVETWGNGGDELGPFEPVTLF